MHFVVVTGMSGAGKSQAVNALEDIGYYCIDNMPPKLLVHFFQLRQGQEGRFPAKIAIVVDSRGGRMFTDLFRGLEQLEQMGYPTPFSIWMPGTMSSSPDIKKPAASILCWMKSIPACNRRWNRNGSFCAPHWIRRIM